MNNGQTNRAFSLVEVVVALAIFSFCIISLLGLCVVGLKSAQESADQLQASNLASLIMAQRRAYPISNPSSTNAMSPILPYLNASTNNLNAPIYLTDYGQVTNSATSATYGLIYNIQADPTGTRVTQVGVTLSSPATVTPVSARIRCDLSTFVYLP